MTEWILVIAIVIQAAPGIIRDPSITTITGFQSAAACTEAGHNISVGIINAVGQLRRLENIKRRQQEPTITTSCVQISFK
jgi:hypothetical protein